MFVLLTHRYRIVPAALVTFCVLAVVLLTASFTHAQSSVSIPKLNAPMGSGPTVSSTLYPNPEQWYNNTDGAFWWTLPTDVTAVAVEMVSTNTAEPMFVYEPPISQFRPDAEDLYEGVQYAALQFRTAAGWGPVAYRKLQLDLTPPTRLYVDLQPPVANGAPNTLVFGAHDELSGVAGFTVRIGNEGPVYVTPEQAGRGFAMPFTEPGAYRVEVTAHDRAGNTVREEFPVYAARYSDPEKLVLFGLFTTRELTLLGMFGLTLFTFWFAIRTMHYYRRREQRLRVEVSEVQEQLEKIFRALHNEIHEQVQSIRNKSKLSKGEQEVVANLDRALEVSETLVNKEMADVKKILK